MPVFALIRCLTLALHTLTLPVVDRWSVLTVMSDDDKPAIVMDNGTGVTKCGFAGEDAPKVTFASCVGYPKQEGMDRDYYVGEEAQLKRGMLLLKYPLEHGVIQNWDAMEKIWKHAFDNELRVVLGSPCGAHQEADEDVTGVMITETALNPKQIREQMTQIMFETFHTRRLFVATQAVLSLYASGRLTGVVVDSGETKTDVMPIYEGYSMAHAIRTTQLGGRDLNDYMTKILQESHINLCTRNERLTVVELKEDLCCVSMNFTEEQDNFAGKEKAFALPDGTAVTVHNQIIRCPELMFNPSMDGKEIMGLHELVNDAVNQLDPSDRLDFVSSVVLAGGNTMFPNMPQRLLAEIRGLMSPAYAANVVAPPERAISHWIGGSIYASLSGFHRMWIDSTSQPNANPPITGYDDIGPRIVHQMCAQ